MEMNEIKDPQMESTELTEVHTEEATEEKRSGIGGLIGTAAIAAIGFGIYQMFGSKKAKEKRQAKKLEKAKAVVEAAGFYVCEEVAPEELEILDADFEDVSDDE